MLVEAGLNAWRTPNQMKIIRGTRKGGRKNGTSFRRKAVKKEIYTSKPKKSLAKKMTMLLPRNFLAKSSNNSQLRKKYAPLRQLLRIAMTIAPPARHSPA